MIGQGKHIDTVGSGARNQLRRRQCTVGGRRVGVEVVCQGHQGILTHSTGQTDAGVDADLDVRRSSRGTSSPGTSDQRLAVSDLLGD